MNDSGRRNCGRCHVCGMRLTRLLDADGLHDYCAVCGQVRRYRSHGHPAAHSDDPETPDCPETLAPAICGDPGCSVCRRLVQPYCDVDGVVHVPLDADGRPLWRWVHGEWQHAHAAAV